MAGCLSYLATMPHGDPEGKSRPVLPVGARGMAGPARDAD